MENRKNHCGAVVLAAGSGKRMNSETKKQFLLIKDKPIIYYSLKAFQESFIDDIVLVVSEEDIDYCRNEIVQKYHFTKVKYITAGGRERYHSVAAGLQCLTDCDYVFIHDGARPMITNEILSRAYSEVTKSGACVTGMPVKDTIKIADRRGFIEQTPDRDLVWLIQTPQVFSYQLIRTAYDKLLMEEEKLKAGGINITDDAMVVETFMEHPVKLVEGSYENIKITTPDDLLIAERLCCNSSAME
ncbi:MAG: 2-C-methyl-D-erythritol 4-phosphate cytidylyltransferase [Lachnospiraceae bacterium]|nr:2-C-methyl-D-erythritol 4-phosphate cytidylyltransferase [Lachnospiraceae bacterium]